MNLTIKDLTQEQYNKIVNFADSITEKKYYLTICRDSDIDSEEEIRQVVLIDGVEDIKIINNLKNYSLCKEFEGNYEPEELKKDGYYLFYAEAYIHSGISLYEFSGALRDKWDSGIAGIIAIKGNDAKTCYRAFKNFLEVWQKCNDNDFYGYKITDNFGEVVDSCWGFWDTDAIKEELPDYITEEQFKKAVENIEY